MVPLGLSAGFGMTGLGLSARSGWVGYGLSVRNGSTRNDWERLVCVARIVTRGGRCEFLLSLPVP